MKRAAILLATVLAGCGTPKGVTPPATVTDIGLGLGSLPKQGMPKRGCAVFLWKAGDTGRMLLVAESDPPTARIVLDGRQRALPRVEATESTTSYADGTDHIALELMIEQRRGLQDGAVISSGSMRLDRAGGQSIIVPVSGLIGCVRP